MKKLLAALVTAALFLVPINAIAAVKAGATCTKLGATSTYSGKKYTCIKSGKKLMWNKGVAIVQPKPSPSTTPTPTPIPKPTETSAPLIDYSKTYSTDDGYFNEFNDPCAFDYNPPSEWKAFQDYYYGTYRCLGPLKLGKYVLGNARPITALTPKSNFANQDLCKIETPDNSNISIGFERPGTGRYNYKEAVKFPSTKTVIQLIPVYADDTANPSKSPKDEYGKYLEFIKSWIEYSSDGQSKVELRYPEKYIKMQGKIGDYQILHTNNWDHPEHKRFNRDVVAAVDPSIDFTGANIGIVVVPGGTPLDVLKQGALNALQTSEGRVSFAVSEYPDTYENPNKTVFANLAPPAWWIHELYHAGFGLEDHYGDSKQDVNSEYGLGWWSLINPTTGDLTIWEKWILGFTLDSQVQCVIGSEVTTHWIAPSSVKTTESKTVVIKISETKVIVLESIRAAGLYYKLPKASQGVLIYTVDLTVKERDFGMKLALPTNRNPNKGPFFLSEAPLRVGESVKSNGVTITILESGTFGDVIKVEK
ncbi:hypothetical protein MCEMRE191_01341 [Candidatus Nanopelagicaceae bacterium]